jgi:nucleoid-associated protein YgaU
VWHFDDGPEGSVRHRVLIGSSAAALLLAAGFALVFRGDFTSRTEPVTPQPAAVSQSEPPPAVSKPAEPDRSPPPPPPLAPVPPSFDVVKIGPDGTAVIAGRAEPGAKVVVRDGDKTIGEVTADRRGEWVLVPEQPMAAGNRLLSAEASGPSAGAAVKSEETVALSIGPGSSQRRAGETALAVVLPRDAAHPARILQLPNGAPAEPNTLAMDTAAFGKDGGVILSGRAAPGATVRIYAGDELLATVTADKSGSWMAASPGPLPLGDLELRLDQLAADGRVAQRVALPMPRSTAEPAQGQEYVVQRGNSLWQIARHAYGAGTRYVIIYSANPDQIRDPARIYPGQVFKLPKS